MTEGINLLNGIFFSSKLSFPVFQLFLFSIGFRGACACSIRAPVSLEILWPGRADILTDTGGRGQLTEKSGKTESDIANTMMGSYFQTKYRKNGKNLRDALERRLIRH